MECEIMRREQITCARCGKVTARRGCNHKHCRKCAREIRNEKPDYHKFDSDKRGNPYTECVPITLEEIDAIGIVMAERGVCMSDLDEMVGKKGKKYLGGIVQRLQDFGRASINVEVMGRIQHWIDSGTD